MIVQGPSPTSLDPILSLGIRVVKDKYPVCAFFTPFGHWVLGEGVPKGLVQPIPQFIPAMALPLAPA